MSREAAETGGAGKTGGLRILVLTQYFWPEDFRINDLARGLRERGHQVTVLTGMPNYPDGKFFAGYGATGPREQDYHGVRVLRVPLVSRGPAKGARLAMNYASFALSASVLGPLRARGGFDVIFVFEPSPITVGIPARVLRRVLGAPVLFWVQDLWPEILQGLGVVRNERVIRGVERLARFVYRGCDRILVQSRAFTASVERLGGAGRIRYFPNTAEDFYRPIPPEEAEGVPPLPDGFRVMVAGNIGASQAFPTLIGAAERLRDDHPDIHFLVVGDGRMRPWVEEQVREKGLRNTVHLLGRHPATRMPHFFAHADALLATLGREPVFEYTIPSKVQSYLACARPVIASLDGEGARVVREAGGLAAPAEDPEALAAAVLAMREKTAEEREAMGARARAYFLEHFDREMLMERLEGWMRELAEARR
ncbi:MAG TPA: glycosyltransferase family 4 protein [Longimicrobium sp.]|nr:glycosyltransferase family 4 protein [Longimicrobium sp.]